MNDTYEVEVPQVKLTPSLKILNQLDSLQEFFTRLPDLPAPTVVRVEIYGEAPTVQWLLFSDEHMSQKDLAVEIVKMIPGKVDKDLNGHNDWMHFTGSYEGVNWEVIVERQAVCTRKVVGVREVTEEVPDPEAPMITRVREEEVVEWDCDPLLKKED